MFATVSAYARYYAALLFGLALAAEFSGLERNRRNRLALFGFSLLLFAVQLACNAVWGMVDTFKLYPLITHLPVACWLALWGKRSWLTALSSMFLSYLCCQPPRWIGAVAGELSGSAAIDHIGYIVTAALLFFVLRRHAAAAVRHLMGRSVKSCLLFCTLPAALYYLFDFATTVYTGLLFSRTRAAVQFMPFAASAFYFAFAVIYSAEAQRQAAVQRERDMLDTQLKHARTELAALREAQQASAAYRHDMRHHIALLSGLAAEERIGDIRAYLHSVQSDIDAITPRRYCENETFNLILSSFAEKAKQAGIALAVDAKLPKETPFSDSEICSLLSNALENAIRAASPIPDASKRQIRLRLFPRNGKLCIDLRNSFFKKPAFRGGLPVAADEGHGFGTRSMVRIVEKHGGVCRFFVQDGWFVFQASA